MIPGFMLILCKWFIWPSCTLNCQTEAGNRNWFHTFRTYISDFCMFLSQWSSTSGKLHFWCHRIGTDTFLLAHTLEARLSFVLLLEALGQVWVHSFWCMKVHSAVCTMYNWPVQEQHADSNLKLSFAISCPNVYSRVISKRQMNRKIKEKVWS